MLVSLQLERNPVDRKADDAVYRSSFFNAKPYYEFTVTVTNRSRIHPVQLTFDDTHRELFEVLIVNRADPGLHAAVLDPAGFQLRAARPSSTSTSSTAANHPPLWVQPIWHFTWLGNAKSTKLTIEPGASKTWEPIKWKFEGLSSPWSAPCLGWVRLLCMPYVRESQPTFFFAVMLSLHSSPYRVHCHPDGCDVCGYLIGGGVAGRGLELLIPRRVGYHAQRTRTGCPRVDRRCSFCSVGRGVDACRIGFIRTSITPMKTNLSIA